MAVPLIALWNSRQCDAVALWNSRQCDALAGHLVSLELTPRLDAIVELFMHLTGYSMDECREAVLRVVAQRGHADARPTPFRHDRHQHESALRRVFAGRTLSSFARHVVTSSFPEEHADAWAALLLSG